MGLELSGGDHSLVCFVDAINPLNSVWVTSWARNSIQLYNKRREERLAKELKIGRKIKENGT
jgi:hypothetical protein